jgi:mRNA-degrading endonuclease toxin of MazEF toxin-antitoxin module
MGHSSTVVLPITSKITTKENFPLRVFLPKGEGDLETDSMVLVDQFLAWDNQLFRKQLGMLSKEKQIELERACREFFGW